MTRVVENPAGGFGKRRRARDIRRNPSGALESSAEGRRLKRLEERGEIRLGAGELPRDFWSMPRPRDPRASVRRAVSEEREEGH